MQETPENPPDTANCLPAASLVARGGLIDMRTQAEVPSALRTDTPTQVALVDVAEADWRKCGSCGGGADTGADDASGK
jgi:hypothetical protein